MNLKLNIRRSLRVRQQTHLRGNQILQFRDHLREILLHHTRDLVGVYTGTPPFARGVLVGLVLLQNDRVKAVGRGTMATAPALRDAHLSAEQASLRGVRMTTILASKSGRFGEKDNGENRSVP